MGVADAQLAYQWLQVVHMLVTFVKLNRVRLLKVEVDHLDSNAGTTC